MKTKIIGLVLVMVLAMSLMIGCTNPGKTEDPTVNTVAATEATAQDSTQQPTEEIETTETTESAETEAEETETVTEDPTEAETFYAGSGTLTEEDVF